jgi:hypothetical protein
MGGGDYTIMQDVGDVAEGLGFWGGEVVSTHRPGG